MKTSERIIKEFVKENLDILLRHAFYLVRDNKLENFCQPDELVFSTLTDAFKRLEKNKLTYLTISWVKTGMYLATQKYKAEKRKRIFEQLFDTQSAFKPIAISDKNEQKIRLELKDHINSSLSFLSKEHREVLVFFADGYTLDEMALLLNISYNTVSQRLHRAKHKFKEYAKIYH